MRSIVVRGPSESRSRPPLMASRLSPCRNSSADWPAATRTEPSASLVAVSTTTSRPADRTKSRLPSVLTMSASSTPASCTLVPE